MPLHLDALLPFGLIAGLFYFGMEAADKMHRLGHNNKVRRLMVD